MKEPHEQLTIYSWCYQAVYWPMYRALYQVSQEMGLKFKWVTQEERSELSNDKAISAAAEAETTLALCEPVNLRKPHRSVTLLWRLPHWLLLNNLSPVDAHQWEELVQASEKIYVFPEDSTSGKYARGILSQPNLQFLPFDVEQYLHKTRSGEACKANDGELALVLLPLHRTHEDRVQVLVDFLGATQEVTALMVPKLRLSQEEGDLGAIYKSIYDKTLMHIKLLLRQLYLTQGVAERVYDIVSRDNELTTSPPRPRWITVDVLTSIVTEYVNRMAFFPYHLVGMALGAKLQPAFQETLKATIPRISKKIYQSFQKTVGLQRSWCDLDHEQRLAALRDWDGPQLLRNALGGRTLPDVLTHLGSWLEPSVISAEPLTCLEKLRVRVHGAYVDLRLLRESMPVGTVLPPVCEAMGYRGSHFATRCCHPDRNTGELCFCCFLAGFSAGILAKAKRMMRDKLDDNIELTAQHCEQKTGLKSLGTAICWTDVTSLFKTFCDEKRPGKRCKLICVHRVSDVEYSLQDVMLAILWDGSTEQHTQSGGGPASLKNWFKRERNAGRPVSGVWFWDRNRDSQWTQIACDDGADDLRDLLWLQLRADVRDFDGFNFAYTAVFKSVGLCGGN